MNKLTKKKFIYNYLVKIIFSFIFLNSITFTQEFGELQGTITSHENGEPLIGINVFVVDTKLGASTDIDGKFNIRKIPVGTYNIKISGVGYKNKIIKNVTIVVNKTTILNTTMEEASIKMEEIVVTADQVRSYETALLSQRKRATTISDGISAEQIKRTPDATTGDVLKRVTGLTLVENKFLFIRGATDRYNVTTLDGAMVSSTEVGKRSFAFDILPANLLDNAVIIKSLTPDLPGDFGGGLVQLNTIDIPSRFLFKLGYTMSSNEMTTNKEFFRSSGGKFDWLGLDDGSRKYPGDDGNILEVAKKAPNNWAFKKSRAPFNRSFSLAIGDKYNLSSDNSKSQFGFVSGISYRNTLQSNKKIIEDFEVGRNSTGTTDEYSVLWGTIVNLSYNFNTSNKIGIKNNFNQTATDQIGSYNTEDFNTLEDKKFIFIDWVQRSVYTGQIHGEHSFPFLNGMSFNWRASISNSKQQQPDRKQITYYRSLEDDPSSPYYAATNQRSWANLTDKNYTVNLDFTLPIKSTRIKFGSMFLNRKSDYRIRYFNIALDFGGDFNLLTLPLETIYNPENFGPKKFIFSESSKPSDTYYGKQELFTSYLMLDQLFEIFYAKFRFSGGVRLENNTHSVSVPKTFDVLGPFINYSHKKVDLLPSLNLTYLLHEKINLKLAYSHSINRPEFRELAPTGFFDFIKYEIVGGNPDLKRAYIRNYDIRAEYYPKIGEIFAISFFYKNITDAIEEFLIHTSTRTRGWLNSSKTKNYGWELEFRKSLDFIGNYFSNFTLIGNYSRIFSNVQILKTAGNSLETKTITAYRPLQGQSPYVINLSLLFVEPTIQTSINLLYNKFGSRLETVGFLASDIYEEPREVLDIVITQPIMKALQLTFTAKNITNKNRILTRSLGLYEKSFPGRTYSLQISFGL